MKTVTLFPWRLLRSLLLLFILLGLVGWLSSANADHTPDPTAVTIAGSLQDELGCSGDWQPDCAFTHLGFDGDDEAWQATYNVPSGSWEYKAALNDSWDENYGANAAPNGANITLDLAAATDIKFYYSHATHWVTDNVNARIATVPGNFQALIGCSGDWQPDCLRTWLQDPDGDQIYEFSTTAIPAGDYEAKVAINESWDENYGQGGTPGGANIPFTVGDGEIVTFSFESATNLLTITTELPGPSGPDSVTIAGSLQDELGCGGDWDPACTATHLTYDGNDDVWQGTFNVPDGSWEYKAALNGSWDENYGQNATPNGPNIPLMLGAATDVKFYYDHKSHWITDNVNATIATVAGNFQAAIGCPGDWQPDCLLSWLQDVDGDGRYIFTTTDIPAGDYEFKVALNEAWDTSYPDNNVPFAVGSDGSGVTFTYDSMTNEVTVSVGGLEPGDELLVRPSVRLPAQDDIFYFVLPDRFENGDTANDTGGDSSGDPLVNGFLPENNGYYHGGDLAGLTAQLPYLDNLGVTAVWLTPQFINSWVQGDGTIAGSSAAYHGYWQIDYSQIDPHFGTNDEMTNFITEAHARGIKVFFDIVANHTGDVITYAEGSDAYISKADAPYLDANGDPFDDRDYAGTGTFPPLDANISFPYTPVVDPGDENVKNPAWLNNPIYYHNRGNSSFSGENSLYGDFFGLDDLFTEHPVVQDGLIAIYQDMITTFNIDGFRLDTVKHVNDEFWQAFGPAIDAHVAAAGNPDFFYFGEVFDGNPAYTSRFTTDLPLQAVLDFGFQGAARNFASQSGATDNLAAFYENDDYYTDADSNAYALPTFLGNHDIGRIGMFLSQDNLGAGDDELVARDTLAHALMFFGRGMPVIYYGDEQGFTGDGGDKAARQDMMPSLVPSYNDDNLIGTSATTADANFDETHILYQTLSEYAQLVEAHAALRQGAQIQRYSEATAGIFAFSRIDRTERVEYLVALNNSEADDSATFATDSPNTTFTNIYPGTAPAIAADAAGQVSVGLPALGVAVYRADAPITDSSAAPGIVVSMPADGSEVNGRVEIVADVASDLYAEVTFAVAIDGGAYEVIGTDDNAPYRVFYNTEGLPNGTTLELKAIVNDLAGNLNAHKVTVSVSEPAPVESSVYAIVHYFREDGDYGDHTTGDFNDFWALHLWGDGIDASEVTDWTSPKPFLGEDEYGRFAWIKLGDPSQPVNFIVHRGDLKDGTDADRQFDAAINPEIWLKQDDAAAYTSQAAAQGYVTIHYHRPDGDYGDPTSADFNDFWGLHLWGDAIAPGVGTEWASPRPFDGIDGYGAYWNVPIQAVDLPVNFIIHRGDDKDPGPDQSMVPQDDASIFIQSLDETIYPSLGAAENTVYLRYHRADGDYGDPSSPDFNDFWGMHVWTGASNPNPSWDQPVRPDSFDIFGPLFKVPLVENASELAYILHRGDTKDPGPDQFLNLDMWGYEVWQLEGEGPDPDQPHYVLPLLGEPGANPGNINQQRAYWVDEDTIAWTAADSTANSYTLHYAPNGGLTTSDTGITGGDSIVLTPGSLSTAVQEKFPHLAGLPALKISSDDLALVPDILKGQIAVSAVNAEGLSVDATGLQIPGVLDDLYTYNGDLGVGWDGEVPTVRVWAPTAKSVTFHLFADSDPATTSSTQPMTWDPATGVWSVTGDVTWKGQFYLFEVEVFVHATGQVEHNLVTDPYSHSLSMNSRRSQLVDLTDDSLKPVGWDEVEKPELVAPEDITIYEIHVRDFSANDPSVPDELKGTFKAFTLDGTYGMNHLKALQAAGLSHLHLLPVFDIATINENKAEWQEPDHDLLATYPPDSELQQEAVTAVENLDGFNWGYDPLHYTTPEGSYSTNPDGVTRIIEFREMVQSLNEDTGLRVVMDVVYNHTNASGQSENSVLDRIVPGYYHRLNDQGQVENSTCCANTASEHNMMEKLMIDSLVTWAVDYKVDAFRFDLMGHHMLRNMENVRAALDALTLEEDGVDGRSIYLYGEGWNFGEVADNARGVNATQLNVGGLGIGTFSDRLRDAVRGGGPFDSGEDLIRRQGFANGLYYDPNALNSGSQAELDTLLLLTDQIRVGMAGNLAGYQFIDRNGNLVTGADVDYNGQPAGYTLDPQEDITYISKHDNQTLFDNNIYKVPLSVEMLDRVRIQNVGMSTVLLGQGVPFLHAGSDLLRSKSLDRDSYNSGDWFNRLDFTYQVNNFGVGLPVAGKNQDNWSIMQPLLADTTLQPGASDIAQSAGLFQELLAIRSSSKLFRLETAVDIQERVAFHNTGPNQLPGLIVMSISDLTAEDLDRAYEYIVVMVNANDEAQSFTQTDLLGFDLELHPVQAASIDQIVQTSTFDPATATFEVPGRTTAVFMLKATPQELIDFLADDVQALVDAGELAPMWADILFFSLDNAREQLDQGNGHLGIKYMNQFINRVEKLVEWGFLSEENGACLIEEARFIIQRIAEEAP